MMYNSLCQSAGVAELADAPDLGSGVLDVQVQVLSPAPGISDLPAALLHIRRTFPNPGPYGALAQLGAHHTGSVGVRGSSPLCSTIANTSEPGGGFGCRTQSSTNKSLADAPYARLIKILGTHKSTHFLFSTRPNPVEGSDAERKALTDGTCNIKVYAKTVQNTYK